MAIYINLTVKILDDENKGIYIMGINLQDFIEQTPKDNRNEHMRHLLDLLFADFHKIDHDKFKKWGVVFYLPGVEFEHRRFVN